MMTCPLTLRQAVGQLLIEMEDEYLSDIADMEEKELVSLHHSLGRQIRNNFGLWDRNKALVFDCGSDHADEASGMIIESLWAALREI